MNKCRIPEPFDEASKVFYEINPLEVPSSLLGEKRLKKIRALPRSMRKSYSWFQELADLNYQNFVDSERKNAK